MEAGSSKTVSPEELSLMLLEDIEKKITITRTDNKEQAFNISNKDSVPFSSVQQKESYKFLYEYDDDESTINWGKSLQNLPVFTLREIEKHRLKSGKTPTSAITKTKERGQKFKNERYISADTIFSIMDKEYFCFKAVALDKCSGTVVHADCSCPAGKCGYCYHVMGLLFDIADYPLHNSLQKSQLKLLVQVE